jgi:hypothetical protein
MTRLFRYLVGIALACSAGSALAQYASVANEDVFRTDQRRYGHLQYFGFYASAMGHWNYTRELAPWTNLTWIHVGSAADEAGAIEAMVLRLREAHEAGVRAVLSIESFLFQNQRGDLRPEADIEDFLVELRARLEFENLLDTLLMIYPKDEPFREFVRYRDPNFIEQYITGEVYEDIHEVLLQANSLVKLVFPETPIGVILSGYELHHRFFSIPENYDWVGFDCYDNLFRSCDDRSFVDHYRRLLNYMQPHQQLMAVPETWVENENMSRTDWPEVLERRFRQHYEMALNEPRFVAFIPFIWSFDAEGETPGLGLNRFVELFDGDGSNPGARFIDRVLRTGLEIKQGQHSYPNMAWAETEDHPARPSSGIRGDIMSITHEGVLSAWAFDDALPHKNLRVRVQVRDARGALIYKSRSERTFIHDGELSHGDRIGRSFTGLHGYRHDLPPDLLRRYGGQMLDVELVVYEDGEVRGIGHIDRQAVRGGFKLWPSTPVGAATAIMQVGRTTY